VKIGDINNLLNDYTKKYIYAFMHNHIIDIILLIIN